MIKIRDLNISFNREVVFEDFNLDVNTGDKLAIVGKSGSGKSTLLNLLAGFIPDFSGHIAINSIILNTKNICEIRKSMAWLPQELALNFGTASELFFAPFYFSLNKESKPRGNDISEMFNMLELSMDLLNKNTGEVSGGQKQRIALVSCLLLNKPILLLDEPTSALDHDTKKKVADLILDIEDLTVIAVTHDTYWAENSDEILQLES